VLKHWHGKKSLEDKEPIMGSSSKAISGNRYERLRSSIRGGLFVVQIIKIWETYKVKEFD
jgi:hypothetical protein